MWTYLIAWTLVSFAMAPLVGRLLARQHHDGRPLVPAQAPARPLIPAQRSLTSTQSAPWRIPPQGRKVNDQSPHRGF